MKVDSLQKVTPRTGGEVKSNSHSHDASPVYPLFSRMTMPNLKPGDHAPNFSGTLADGTTVSLKDYLGKKLILYFYPMDDTPGCTAQACSLRDANADIQAKGAMILGVSTQNEYSHRQFSSKFKLNFPLLADTDRSVGKAYGAIGGGGLLSAAKAIVGIADRVTFIIDEKGVIAHVIHSINTKTHADEVLALL